MYVNQMLLINWSIKQPGLDTDKRPCSSFFLTILLICMVFFPFCSAFVSNFSEKPTMASSAFSLTNNKWHKTQKNRENTSSKLWKFCQFLLQTCKHIIFLVRFFLLFFWHFHTMWKFSLAFLENQHKINFAELERLHLNFLYPGSGPRRGVVVRILHSLVNCKKF